MSQRLGPADGRCFTIHTSNRLMNDQIMNLLNIPLQDNSAYRNAIAEGGQELLDGLMKPVAQSGQINNCAQCRGPNPFGS